MDNSLRSQQWLLLEYEKFRARNPRFTLRAMALRLDMSSGRLSEFMSGKRRITAKSALRIADQLGFDPQKKDEFLRVARADGDLSKASKNRKIIPPQYAPLDLDQFTVIADWFHCAILSLMETKDFMPDEAWIAKRLKISRLRVKAAVLRLQRLGLIRKTEKSWISTGRNIETPSDIASSALRAAHRQDLERTLEALDQLPVSERDITAITMAVDVRKLPEAKIKIQKFRKELAAFLETKDASEVYNLQIQFVPLSNQISKGQL